MTYIPGTGPQVRGRMLLMMIILKMMMLIPILILSPLSLSSLPPGCPCAPPPVARHTWRPDSRYTQNMWGWAVTGGTLKKLDTETQAH